MAACTHLITAPEAAHIDVAVGLYFRGAGYLELGDPNRAIADYTQSIAANIPKFGAPYLGRAQARLQIGQNDLALQDVNQAIAIEPNVYDSRSLRVEINMARKDWAKALDDCNYVIKNFPQNASSQYYQLAEIYLQLGELDHALAAAETSVKIAPRYVQSYDERAHVLFAMGRYKDVIADASLLIRSQPQYVGAYFMKSYSQAMMLDFGPALSDADAAVAIAPRDTQSLGTRCMVRAMANQRIDEALADCNTALQADPHPIYAEQGRGMVYLRKGMNSEALKDLDRILRVTPDNLIALYLHGIALVRLGRTAEGRAEIAKAQQQDKANCDAFASMGFTA